MCDEVGEQDVELLPLPKNWQASVRNAVLNVIGIVRIAMLAGREELIINGDVKEARIQQLESEVAMLREEPRINGTRCSALIRTDAPNTQPLNEWPSYSCGRCEVGTKRKQLAVSLFRTIPSEHGFGEPMTIRWLKLEPR